MIINTHQNLAGGVPKKRFKLCVVACPKFEHLEYSAPLILFPNYSLDPKFLALFFLSFQFYSQISIINSLSLRYR